MGGEAHPALYEAFISVIDENDDTLLRDMPHELTHLVFHQLVAQGQPVPTWFDEGLAVYNQLFHEPEMKDRFKQAVIDKALLRLDTISDSFPAGGDAAYLAYAQSWDLITYMYTTFGQSKMKLLIKKMNDPESDFNDALTQALGLDQKSPGKSMASSPWLAGYTYSSAAYTHSTSHCPNTSLPNYYNR